ncbi:MAG: hypothetical protein NT075_23285 [Chloroflexi bacterium]|nr:hypothetical protein [Chloroflexota bacterium]
MDSREEVQSAQQGIGCMWAMLKLVLVVVMLIFLLGVMAGAVVMAMAG